MDETRFPYGYLTVNSSPCFTYVYPYIAFSRWDNATEVCKLVH